MERAFAIAGAKAKIGESNSSMPTPQTGRILAAFAKIFPDYTSKLLARLLGLSESGARKKLDGDRKLDIDEFCVMLHTDEGFEYLTAVMAESQVKWWRLMSASMTAREAQRLQAAARTRIRRVIRESIDADADLSAAIARAEAFSDQEFHRPHADALRSMGRLQNRTMAPAGKQRR